MLDVVCMKGLAITSRKHFHHSNRVGISITNYGITERKPSILRKVFNELKYVKISVALGLERLRGSLFGSLS